MSVSTRRSTVFAEPVMAYHHDRSVSVRIRSSERAKIGRGAWKGTLNTPQVVYGTLLKGGEQILRGLVSVARDLSPVCSS
jgi:hypothetical protein